MNSSKISKNLVTIFPINNVIKRILEIMQDNQYLGECKEIEDNKGNSMEINLIGAINKCNVIKPHFSVKKDEYEKYEKRFLPSRNMGIMIVSTSEGIMTHTQAKKKNIGGKLLAFCY